MLRIMRKYGRKNFEFGQSYVRFKVPYNWDGTNNGTNNGTENVLENVLETSLSLSQKLSVTDRTIRRNLVVLQQYGYIRHDGPDKGGRWLILKKI